MPMKTDAATASASSIEAQIAEVGALLGRALTAVVAAAPGGARGTMAVARALGIDKVLSSRLLKAVRFPDPMALVYQAPGPEPLRRMLKAAAGKGVDRQLIADARAAVDAFEALIRAAGDRGSLDAMLTAWLPDLRQPFELSRKQAAFKAMSQLRGASAETIFSVALIRPSDDQATLDVAWLQGVLGLQRIRPGIPVKFANRRLSRKPAAARLARTLSGEPVEGIDGLYLPAFCSQPLPRLEARGGEDAVHYVLANGSFGPGSLVDLVFADVTLHEMRRYSRPELKLKPYLFAEAAIASKALVFDVFLDPQVYPGSTPELHLYDTALDGLAKVNDPAREVDRLDFMESIQTLGRGVEQCRLRQYPRYTALLRHVFDRLGWEPSDFRGYRCAIDYPIYGSQVAMSFEAPLLP
jgi:hypothetical protein